MIFDRIRFFIEAGVRYTHEEKAGKESLMKPFTYRASHDGLEIERPMTVWCWNEADFLKLLDHWNRPSATAGNEWKYSRA